MTDLQPNGRGPLIVYADGPDGPLPAPEAVAELTGLAGARPEVVLGWVVRDPGWLETTRMPLTTVMIGAGLRAAVDGGVIKSVATRLSAMPGLLCGRMRPAVAVVGAHEDGSGHWRLAGSPGWAALAAERADQVVVERWPGRALPGAAAISDDRVAAVMDRSAPPDTPPAHKVGPAHRRIGELVAGLIPEGATVQWGPGVIGASAIDALTTPVRVRSGLVTEELVGLAERELLVGPAHAAYFWGGPSLKGMVESGALVLRPVSYIHDLTALSATESFVALNTALQVGLDGSVNVEGVRGRIVAGPGGHPDFATGASRSPGGLSIVALKSTAGAQSTIVGRVDITSTARTDVDLVVTEYGVADLRGCDDAERAQRMMAIADPAHRETLERE